MYFEYYPADTQECTFHVRSCEWNYYYQFKNDYTTYVQLYKV